MKIFLTGGAGYVGGTVARILRRSGAEITVFDNLYNSKREAVAEGATFIDGDLLDESLLKKALRETHFDGIMHFAALIEAGESMKDPGKFFQNNTAGTLNLLQAMQETGHDRLVFSSTAACYGEPESVPIHETARLQPTNAYGESKLLVEKMLAWFHSIHGMRYTSLRYFNVAGAIDGYGEAHEPESHLIPLILDVALGRREAIKVYGRDYETADGTCIRDFVHVEDLAHAHILALKSLDQPGRGIYNIGSGHGFSVLQVIESARRVTGHAIPVIEEPRRPGDPAKLVASSDKIRQTLGWEPKYPELDQIIESAWKWHQVRYKN